MEFTQAAVCALGHAFAHSQSSSQKDWKQMASEDSALARFSQSASGPELMGSAAATVANVSSRAVVATLFGAIAGVGGYLFAFFYDFPVGGSQTVFAAAMVAVATVLRMLVHAVQKAR